MSNTMMTLCPGSSLSADALALDCTPGQFVDKSGHDISAGVWLIHVFPDGGVTLKGVTFDRLIPLGIWM